MFLDDGERSVNDELLVKQGLCRGKQSVLAVAFGLVAQAYAVVLPDLRNGRFGRLGRLGCLKGLV